MKRVFGHTERTRLAAAVVAGGAVLAASCAIVTSAAASHPAERADHLVVNVAVDAPASATSAEPDHPAALATDGNAATSWCPTAGDSAIVVDLGRTQVVSGFGLSLADSGAGAGAAAVEIAAAGNHGGFRAVAAATVPVGTPTWIPAERRDGVVARKVRLRVTGEAPVCVGELRVLGSAPGGCGGRAIGHDLSFAVQEAAVGNTY
ncbi:MAG TPA: discoidin domain-containing protein, partial [Kofleriaceae bacterium]|nr:discoidin domain-containing protein [Kofleriaceae bacterium]